MQDGYIFISRKDGKEIVYGNNRFFVNKGGVYKFDFRHNWILVFLLLTLTEGTIWLSQYIEPFFFYNKLISFCLIVITAYLATKLSNLLINKLKLGYKRENLKRIRLDLNVDEEMISSCQKKYVSNTLKEVGFILFAILLYSIFFFTVRLYGLIFGMLIMTVFCMMRKLSNYPVYRVFVDLYKKGSKTNDKNIVENEIVKASTKKRNR